MRTKTITTVKIVTDEIDIFGDRYEAIRPLVLEVEDGVLTISGHGGNDMWRCNLADLN